jgi:hypothetical protein
MEVRIIQLVSHEISNRFANAPGILTDASRSRFGEEKAANPDLALSPESIAKVSTRTVFCQTPLLIRFLVVPLPRQSGPLRLDLGT